MKIYTLLLYPAKAKENNLLLFFSQITKRILETPFLHIVFLEWAQGHGVTYPHFVDFFECLTHVNKHIYKLKYLSTELVQNEYTKILRIKTRRHCAYEVCLI